MMTTRTRPWFFLALLLALTGGAAQAQDAFPSRAMRIVVPYSAGGTADVLARLFAQHLGQLYAQQVVVDNRPGAGGHIGADLVAKSPPDGYNLVLGAIGTHAGYAIYKKLSYDPATDLQAVTVVAEVPNVVIVHPSLPATTIVELIALAKAKPGAINFGTAGNGTSTHLTTELFKILAGVEMTHVPYRGSAPALNDLVAGQIQLMFENIPTTPPHIRSGALRALGVTTRVRSPVLPEVPTIAEAGLPAYEASAWFTLAAPSGLPKPVLDKLSADLMRLIATPAVNAQIRELGAIPVGNSPEAANRFLAAEREKWTKVIVTAGITGE
ncbi:MAG: tripartite tricarboxylate transporter substrate binding protein [Proteobacteria bacterium]|nr:tripartite tricarboxylate transporter substrate binding protein [Pseudomonadota bacterium]